MRQWIAMGIAGALVAGSLPFIRNRDGAAAELLSRVQKKPSGATTAVTSRVVTPPPLTDVDLSRIDDRRAVATAPGHGERTAELTVSPRLQRAAVNILRQGRVPEGAIVLTDVKTGNVLVWANYVEDGPERNIAGEATAPTASVFKIITGTALVEAGLNPGTKQCYSGGEHTIRAVDMIDDKKRDRWCATLGQALGRSLNTVFARLAAKNLDKDKLGAVAARFGYGQDLPFDVPIAQSTLTFPDDDLGFARTAAGFWNSTLSPFEGVNIAMIVANGGEMIRMHVVSGVRDEEGPIYTGPTGRQVIRRVMEPQTAEAMTTMMETTVEGGTSYKSFHDKHGKAFLPDIKVAGKTGTLTKPATDGPYYTWFVGFAPSRKPEVAISVLAANHLKWRVKATNMAADMLRIYFADKKSPGVRDPAERGSTARR